MRTTIPQSSVGDWLQETGLRKYESLFRENEIDLELLPELDGEDLKELGIPFADRKRFLKAIARLKSSAVSPPPSVREEGEPSTQTARAERRQVTIMFCDLADSTALANELDPEEFADVLRDYQHLCSNVLQRWGGYIARFSGDGVLAYFGWPQAREDDPERAVRAGLELSAAVGRMPVHERTAVLAVRVGIATGVVMIGELIGEGLAQEETVVGAVPNLAARLQAAAERGGVVIAPTTHQLVSRRFAFADLGLQQLKGFPQPIRLWRADRPLTTTRFEARAAHRLTAMVGRKQETRFLMELWRRAQDGSGQAVLLTGEAGVGKSRLIQALAEEIKGAPHTTLRWQCSSYYAGSALRPFVEQFNRFAATENGDAGEAKLRKAEQILAARAVDLGEAAAVLARLLSVSFGEQDTSLNLPLQRRKTIEVVANLVLGIRGKAPLLLIVEDVHWADPTTLDVLKDLIGRIEQEPVMVIITCRPEFDPGWDERLRIARLRLKRLAQTPARLMVRRIIGGKALPRTVLDSIVSTTDGIPLFVEELTRTVIESGQLREAEDRYELRGSVLDLSVPATLHDSLAARLDRLASSKDIAQVAATIGRIFSPDLLARVLQRPARELRAALLHLCEAGILEQRGGASARRYVFKHALIQEVAYRSQLNARRRELHDRIARTLETYFPDEASALPEMLAHHFAEGGSNEIAGNYLLKASRNALRVTAISEAISHLNRALELIAPLPSSESRDLLALRLYASLGTALMLSKSWAAPDAEAAYSAANSLSHAAKDPSEANWILWGIWVYHHVRGNVRQAVSISERIRATADRNSNADTQLIADMIGLQASFYTGRFEEAVGRCKSVEHGFSPARHRSLVNLYTIDLELVALVHDSIACWVLGKSDEAASLALKAEQVARNVDHAYSTAWTLTWGSTPYLLAGDLERLVARLEEGIAIASSRGFSYILALGNMMRGWVAGQTGAVSEGIAQMKYGLDAFQATGAGIVIPHFRTLLAEVLNRAGHSSEALEMLRAAEDQIELWGESWQLAEVYRVRGDALVAANDASSAQQSYERAIAIAASQEATAWQLRARAGLLDLRR